MRVIGLTGGVGAGKSRVLSILRDRYQAQVLETDRTAGELMEPGKPGYEAVVKALGSSFLEPDGSMDRKKLASLLFGQAKARHTVNEIIHPMVWKTIEDEISASQAGLIVVESAIMDSVHNEMFDEIWYVYTSEEKRRTRLKENRGYTDERIRSIMDSQCTEEEYKSFCSAVIDNNGTVEDIISQLDAILNNEGQEA